ncbi:aspartic proteinase [Metarhizium brunneum]
MKATIAAIALAILADGAVARERVDKAPQAPAPGTNGRSFTLNQVQNKDFQGHDGPMSFLRAHFKYAKKLPDYLSKLVEIDPNFRIKFGLGSQADGQIGTVLADPTPLVDTQYAIEIGIGTPPQHIRLNLDTGSSDFWVFSTDTNPSMVDRQVLYDADKSMTSHFLAGESWKIKYGDNASASGYVYTDRVQIGETYVDTQAVQVAVNLTKDLSSDNFVSGILGMANSAANTVRPTPQRTYIHNIKDNLAQPLFTANLQRQAPGSYNFGYIDDSQYKGSITYTPVEPSFPLWMVSTTGYRIAKTSHNERIDSIVDTGTSLLLLPETVVSSYYAKVRGSSVHPQLGMRLVPCNADLPDFYLNIGSYRGRVPGSYMNYGRISGNSCFGGMQSSGDLPFSVLGDVFLKAQFVVFDYGNARVGFANKQLYE